MLRNMTISKSSPFTRASYAVLVVGLTLGTVVMPFDLHLALLPAVLIFGWSQIGGL
jgi:hypothetical protein